MFTAFLFDFPRFTIQINTVKYACGRKPTYSKLFLLIGTLYLIAHGNRICIPKWIGKIRSKLMMNLKILEHFINKVHITTLIVVYWFLLELITKDDMYTCMWYPNSENTSGLNHTLKRFVIKICCVRSFTSIFMHILHFNLNVLLWKALGLRYLILMLTSFLFIRCARNCLTRTFIAKQELKSGLPSKRNLLVSARTLLTMMRNSNLLFLQEIRMKYFLFYAIFHYLVHIMVVA